MCKVKACEYIQIARFLEQRKSQMFGNTNKIYTITIHLKHLTLRRSQNVMDQTKSTKEPGYMGPQKKQIATFTKLSWITKRKVLKSYIQQFVLFLHTTKGSNIPNCSNDFAIKATHIKNVINKPVYKDLVLTTSTGGEAIKFMRKRKRSDSIVNVWQKSLLHWVLQ